jgi:hypothetical protein
MKLKYLIIILASFVLSSCAITNVSIKVNPDNSSEIECVLFTRKANAAQDEIGGKFRKIKTIALEKNIYIYINKKDTACYINNQYSEFVKHTFTSKVSSPEKMEDLCIIIANVFDKPPNTFWLKLFPVIEDNEKTKWEVQFEYTGDLQKGCYNCPNSFLFSAQMPEIISGFEPSKNSSNLRIKKDEKKINFYYTEINREGHYKINISAIKKKPKRPESKAETHPVVINNSNRQSQVVKVEMPKPKEENVTALKPSETKPDNEKKTINTVLQTITALLAALAALIAALAAYRNASKKKNLDDKYKS